MLDIIHDYWRNYLFSDGYYMTGVAMTLWLLVLSVGIGFLMSVPLAVARNARSPAIWGPVWLFTYVFRGTPLYIQLLLFYSGIYSLHWVQVTPVIGDFFKVGFNCAILCFTLNTCAYTTEIFAGSMRGTPHGEIEAARAFGMSHATLYLRIIIPGALRRALPAYSNEVILMLHATTLAFTATVPDILKIARDVNSATYDSFDAYGIAALLYLGISFSLVYLFRRAERRWLAYLER